MKNKITKISESVLKIELTRSKSALIDADDLTKISQYHWYCSLQGYAVTNPGTRKEKEMILMHRLVNDTPIGMQTDHTNQNKLDNRKINLRTVTSQQNKWNKGPQANNSSGYKGVSLNKFGTWEMQIRNGVERVTKRFKTKEEAALAYNEYARQLHGDFAYQNKIGASS